MEATDPRHLIEDSAELGHCVGTASSVPGSTDPAHLHYWRKIASGKSRIFTITYYRVPYATIEFDVANREITQIAGCQGRTFDRLYHPGLTLAICRWLGELRHALGIKKILPLHHPMPRGLYTIDGFVANPQREHLADALGGTITIGPANMDLFWPAFATSLIGVDVTEVPQAYLDQIETCCVLYWMDAAPLRLPRLAEGEVSAWRPFSVALEAHVQGDLHLGCTSSLYAPRHASGAVSACWVETLALPSHRAGLLECHAARDLILPSMEEGEIRNDRAQSVDLPRLRKGAVTLHAARELTAPMLKHAKVDVPSLSVVDLPALETRHVSAPRAKTVLLPQFRDGQLHIDNATTVELPTAAPPARVESSAAVHR